MKTRKISLAAVGLSAALVWPLAGEEPAEKVVDSAQFQPIQSSARTAADLVREAAWRQAVDRSKASTSEREGASLATGEREGASLSITQHGVGGGLEDLTAEADATAATKAAGYEWQVEQTWLPGDRGIQWCVHGSQSVRPIGGVKLYFLPAAYAGLRSLQRDGLVVTLAAQEQVPGPGTVGRSGRSAMAHSFDYGTCVAPELTRVGTYRTAATFCGSRSECANGPHVLPVTLELKPFLWSFDVCLDRHSGEVDVFHSALYFDQRPSAASLKVLLDGTPVPGAQLDASWPWVFVEYHVPVAEYDSRFGANGGFGQVELQSESRYTPAAKMFFARSEWLPPCIN
jgi:hypothetical protein